jgi:hypothetical protein
LGELLSKYKDFVFDKRIFSICNFISLLSLRHNTVIYSCKSKCSNDKVLANMSDRNGMSLDYSAATLTNEVI